MHRAPKAINPQVEALLDERDQLQIRISLAADAPDADPMKLAAMRVRVANLDAEIEQLWARKRQHEA